MEQLVLEKVRASMNGGDMCKCNKCYYDVCSIVLNNMGAPHYITSPEGALMKRATFMSSEAITSLYVEIFKAIELVMSNLKH